MKDTDSELGHRIFSTLGQENTAESDQGQGRQGQGESHEGEREERKECKTRL